MPVWRDGRLAAAPVHPAALPRQGRRRLDGHAGRLRAHRRRHRRARRQPAARRPHRRRLGAVGRAGRRDDAAADARAHRRSGATTGVLPSRAADNLFWVGRYVERAEATLRLVRALINRIAEADETAAPLVARDQRAARRLERRSRTTSRTPRPVLIARAALPRGDFDGSLPHLVDAARVGRFGHSRPLLARRLARARRASPPRSTRRCRPGRRKARCSSASTRRCASSRRSPASRRRT